MVDLKNGWIAVKNRDTLVEEEEAGGLGASFEAESAWFEGEAKLGDAGLRARQCGIAALLGKIDALFSEHIKASWVPKFIAHLHAEQARVDSALHALGTPPSSLNLDEVLGGFVSTFASDPESSDAVERNILMNAEKLVTQAYEAVPLAARQHDSTVLSRVKAKDQMKAILFDGLDQIVEHTAVAISKSVQNGFQTDGDDPQLRIMRFEVLCDVMCEAVRAHVRLAAEDFKKFVCTRLEDHFLRSVGCPLVGSSAGGAGLTQHVAQYIITESAVRCLVLPILGDPTSITDGLMAFLRTKNQAAEPPVEAAAKPRGKGGKGGRPVKRKREEVHDVPTAEGGAMMDDGEQVIDERSLLVETCAQERADLVAKKHNLFVALRDIEAL